MLNRLLTKLGIYSRLQLLLTFEFGVTLMDVCQQHNLVLTKEHMVKIEQMLVDEIGALPVEQYAKSQGILILAILQEIFPTLKDKEETNA